MPEIKPKINYWRPPEEGVAFIDIVPYRVFFASPLEVKNNQYLYKREFWVHWDDGYFLCPKKNEGENCDRCVDWSRVLKEGGEIGPDMKPKHRVVYNVRDRVKDEMFLWHTSHWLVERVLQQTNFNFVDPMKGFAIQIASKRARAGFPEYTFGAMERDPLSLSVLERTIDLSKLSWADLYVQVPSVMGDALFAEPEKDAVRSIYKRRKIILD